METPLSSRRVTRSQTALASSNGIPLSRKLEESEQSVSKSRIGKQYQDRSALIDITNDSPIVGLATGNMVTPSSSIAKQKNNRAKITPGSGEALLRGQVKTLLQKVEEEAELSKLTDRTSCRPFLNLKGLVNSPTGLLAPTPANTPQVSDLSSSLAAVSPIPVVEEQLIHRLVSEIFDGKKEESNVTQKDMITRSLLLDFSDKFENTDSSSSGVTVGDPNDDNASVWSIQVNASTHDEDDDDEIIEPEEGEEEEEYYEDEYENGDGGLVDELCAGISNMSMNGVRKMAKFEGKHTRFVYNSDDDEIIEGEECGGQGDEDSGGASPSVMRLKGLPTPKGKHLRFSLGEEEMEG